MTLRRVDFRLNCQWGHEPSSFAVSLFLWANIMEQIPTTLYMELSRGQLSPHDTVDTGGIRASSTECVVT
jgi:hypothetical protein